MKKKAIRIVGYIIWSVVTFLALLLVFSIKWVLKTWVNLTMEEMLYTLTALEGTADDMVVQYVVASVIPSVLIMIILLGLGILFYRKYEIRQRIQIGSSLFVVVLVIWYGVRFWVELDVSRYLVNQSSEAVFIDQYYVNPADATIEFPEEKRNLIYIYLESMETTYADIENGGGFQYNCIPELTELAQNNEDFSGAQPALNGGYALTGSTWTMGALFAQTSGIPLQISINSNDMETQDVFFQGMVNLGDILEEQGYKQAFMIGSEGRFGGRKLFFEEHGSYNVLDYEYAIEEELIPNTYMVSWGYEDGKLFEFAKEEVAKLASQDEPFNFTMLTVDTHFEDGYVCESCGTAFGDNQYANVMACSSSKVAAFVEWIQQQTFYENTTIVISGDHLTMDSDFCNNIEDAYDRKTYTCFINPGCINEMPEKERVYTTMDLFPTTLASLGAQIEGERLGLGTNLFSDTQTLTETYGVTYVDNEVSKQSDLLMALGEIDTTTDAYLKKINKYPTAVILPELDVVSRELKLEVSGITNMDNLSHVEVDFWTEEFEARKRSLTMELEGDVYTLSLSLPQNRDKLVYTEIYAVENNGRRYQIGELAKDLELYTSSMSTYLSLLQEKGYTVFIAARDDAAGAIKPLVRKKLRNLGLQIDLKNQNRSSYYAVVDNGQVLCEKISQDRISEAGVLGDDKTKYSIMSSGFDSGAGCSIKIKGIERASGKRGLNIVVYDSGQDTVVDSVCFDTYSGDAIYRRGITTTAEIMQGEMPYAADETIQTENMTEYLELLKSCSMYTVFIAVKDDAGYALTEDIKTGLEELGLKIDYANFYRSSYCAIIDGDSVIEQQSQEKVGMSGALDNGVIYELSSGGFTSGVSSSIMLEGIQLSLNRRGMNFVIYDKEKRCVVDVVTYDTHDAAQVIRK